MRPDYMVRAIAASDQSMTCANRREFQPPGVNGDHRALAAGGRGLVVATLLVGGATRLTGSGLSIVEWKPVTGTLPPLSEAQWQAEFEKYKTIPQYRELNRRHESRRSSRPSSGGNGAHRLLGRVIGAVFLLPFLFFLWRGGFERGLKRAALADLRARRAAGRGRLVDGGVRPGRADRACRSTGWRSI